MKFKRKHTHHAEKGAKVLEKENIFWGFWEREKRKVTLKVQKNLERRSKSKKF